MKSVQILLSTYNGDKYLQEQLDSLLNQTGVNVKIAVRDDGSNDKTINILEEYKKKNKLVYIKGNNVGYKKSFLILSNSFKDTADYYAYCDQDDYWEPTKLVSAVNELEKNASNKYRLYFSNLRIVNENLLEIGVKDFSKMPRTLGSAMVRSSVAGCTMVFNNELLALALKSKGVLNGIFSHDSWLYKVCLSVGGTIFFDSKSYIKYRQHGHNVTGIKQGFYKRVRTEIKGLTSQRNERSKSAKVILEEYRHLMPYKNICLLTDIVSYKNNPYRTLKLIFNKNLRFKNLIIDLLSRIAIVVRSY